MRSLRFVSSPRGLFQKATHIFYVPKKKKTNKIQLGTRGASDAATIHMAGRRYYENSNCFHDDKSAAASHCVRLRASPRAPASVQQTYDV